MSVDRLSAAQATAFTSNVDASTRAAAPTTEAAATTTAAASRDNFGGAKPAEAAFDASVLQMPDDTGRGIRIDEFAYQHMPEGVSNPLFNPRTQGLFCSMLPDNSIVSQVHADHILVQIPDPRDNGASMVETHISNEDLDFVRNQLKAQVNDLGPGQNLGNYGFYLDVLPPERKRGEPVVVLNYHHSAGQPEMPSNRLRNADNR